MLEKGCANMVHHINIIRKSGINPVVCINRFHTDTEAEDRNWSRRRPKRPAHAAPSLSTGPKGGEGALELADAVIDACNEKSEFKFLYPLEMKLRERVAMIAKEVYGADGVSWTPGGRSQGQDARSPTRSTTTTPP